MLNRLKLYAQLTRLDKPVGTLLLLWPTLWALWLAAAPGSPSLLNLGVFIAGVVLMRSAGCAINDYADRHIDPHVARTCTRPLAAGLIQPWEALAVFAVLSLLAFALVFLLNPLTQQLAVVGLLLAASYPFMKRIHAMPQLHLGIAFAWAVPMAYAAQSGQFNLTALLLFLATVTWTIAYDTMYALADREDDLKIGVKSTAILFGRFDRLIIGLFQLATLLILALVGWIHDLGLSHGLSLLVAAGLSLWQQWLIRDYDSAACIRAFKNNQWLGAVVFIGIIF
ncbi:MAG: 4-hydroxybenzoate polyprenyltransferase [Gammaproteobacteria bacterium 28-57-27]|nr:MAG: 4-hydroxybenzoate polyprenyltransferase [Gammaproteobacteria bacterium 28-57-27]